MHSRVFMILQILTLVMLSLKMEELFSVLILLSCEEFEILLQSDRKLLGRFKLQY
jgi:hypothetical protein